MKVDRYHAPMVVHAGCVTGVRPWLCDGEPLGEIVHGTGYHDRCGAWKNGRNWIRRYPDAKVHNRMSRHVLRCRDAFHALRDMPDLRRGEYERINGGPFAEYVSRPVEPPEAHEQAVRVLAHLLNWMTR